MPYNGSNSTAFSHGGRRRTGYMEYDLSEKNILVPSGPTRADIDAMRFLSNRSTGRLGARIAAEALSRGARVTLVAGRGSAVPGDEESEPALSGRLRVAGVETVDDLLRALRRELAGGTDRYDAIVHAMAVLDYEPVRVLEEKVESGREKWDISLKRTPKVIANLRDWSPHSLLVAFKLGSGCSEAELVRAAVSMLRRNRADFVLANDLQRIEGENHPAMLIDGRGAVIARPGTKEEIARCLCDTVAASGSCFS